MTMFGNQDTRGDLFIEYTVVLPVEVSLEMRHSEFSIVFPLPRSPDVSPKNSWTHFKYPHPHETNYEVAYRSLDYSDLPIMISYLCA